MPGCGDSTPLDEEFGETTLVYLEKAKESLEPLVGGIDLGIARKEIGKALEIDAPRRKESNESGGEAFPARLVPAKRGKGKFDRMEVGHCFGRFTVCFKRLVVSRRDSA